MESDASSMLSAGRPRPRFPPSAGFLCSFAALTHGASATHDAALAGVLAAPISFFASNPPGAVLNRFSGDQRAVDDDLPETLVDLWAGLTSQIAGFVLAVVAFPPVLAAIAPAAALLWWLRALYVAASAQAQRLEAAARSPVLARMRAMVEVRSRRARARWLRCAARAVLVPRAARCVLCALCVQPLLWSAHLTPHTSRRLPCRAGRKVLD
jgi:hypothetical protein